MLNKGKYLQSEIYNLLLEIQSQNDNSLAVIEIKKKLASFLAEGEDYDCEDVLTEVKEKVENYHY